MYITWYVMLLKNMLYHLYYRPMSILYSSVVLLFCRLRTSDMLAMSEHKCLSEKSIRQLVDAAITFDMLSVKLEKPICLELSSQPKPARQSNCKGDIQCRLDQGFTHDSCSFNSPITVRPLPRLIHFDQTTE